MTPGVQPWRRRCSRHSSFSDYSARGRRKRMASAGMKRGRGSILPDSTTCCVRRPLQRFRPVPGPLFPSERLGGSAWHGAERPLRTPSTYSILLLASARLGGSAWHMTGRTSRACSANSTFLIATERLGGPAWHMTERTSRACDAVPIFLGTARMRRSRGRRSCVQRRARPGHR